jgi:hypothetical protein
MSYGSTTDEYPTVPSSQFLQVKNQEATLVISVSVPHLLPYSADPSVMRMVFCAKIFKAILDPRYFIGTVLIRIHPYLDLEYAFAHSPF